MWLIINQITWPHLFWADNMTGLFWWYHVLMLATTRKVISHLCLSCSHLMLSIHYSLFTMMTKVIACGSDKHRHVLEPMLFLKWNQQIWKWTMKNEKSYAVFSVTINVSILPIQSITVNTAIDSRGKKNIRCVNEM